jgi:hypothetical protein
VPALLVFALCGGALVSLIAGPIIGAISFTYAPFALIAALAVFTASTITLVALKAFGSKAVPFVLLILLILGSPSSGGAVAPELLPAFFRFIHQWLPTGGARAGGRPTRLSAPAVASLESRHGPGMRASLTRRDV